MKIKQMAERLNRFSVRQKAKRIVALTLAMLMVNPVTGYGVTAHAQEGETITAFAKLSSEITTQQLAVGAKKSDIYLPETLNVTIGVSSVKTKENAAETPQTEENLTEEVKADESPADASTVWDNSAEESQAGANSPENNTATDSKATVVMDSGEVPLAANTDGFAISAVSGDVDTEPAEAVQITAEERTLMGITWEINTQRSGSDIFNSAHAGAVFFYEPVLPQGYVLADGVSLPQIQVQIEQNNQWAFSQNQTLDGIKITVKAEKGVFPEGAFLHAKKVNNTEDKEKIQSAISEEVKAENSAKTVTKLVSFDITITDAEGNELQPDTSKGEVKVSFAQLPMVTEAATSTQELKVFHMDDTLSTATKLDTTVNEETKSVEATAEHFSLYTVAMLTATAETGEASVTDSADTVTYYDTIEEAILVAQSKVNSTVKLLKDAGTESPIQITTGSFILDLNGKTMTYTDASGRGTTAIEMKSGAKLSVKDSVGNGGITAANARNSITAGSGCTLTLYAGSYTGIDTMPELVSSALAEGVDFENLDNTDEWISRATIALLNMQHVGNVRVGKMPAAVEVSEQGGGVHYYDTITEAISGAISLPESTLKLNKDISLNSELRITGGTFNFDLNGHTLTFTGSGNVMLQQGASITFKDSVGTGKISNSSIWATIYIQGDANAKLQGGTYENAKSGGEGINVLGDRNIGDLLVEGYIYRNLSDNAYISDTSSYKIGSVKVVPAPLKITNQPQDKTVQFDYTELPTFTVGFSKTVTENPTFKWYSVGTGTGGADEAMDGEETAVLAVEAGKSAGQYKYFCG